jgi:hypothetical protein
MIRADCAVIEESESNRATKEGDLDEHDCDMACENYGDAQPTHRFHDLE